MARAFAKVILFGEHAVVHGRTAIAAAIERGAEAKAKRAETSVLRLHPWGRVTELGVGVPGGAGLGCSAAIAVSLARAALEATGRTLDDERIAECAQAWERVFHGNPSGVDATIAARGGVISFKKGAPVKPVVPGGMMELAIAYTGEPSSTKSMVEAVARQLARRPQVVERTFDGIDTLAIKGAQAIEAGLWYEVGRLMDLNHALLASLMVSTETIERACHVARDAGAMGAKLTGGGGGGCVVALAPGKLDAVISAWKAAGFDAFSARVGKAVGS
jgi:mevalonate kinase